MPADALATYAKIYAVQQFEQAVLCGLGSAAKGQPLLALAYFVNLVLEMRAARTGDLEHLCKAKVMIIVLYVWRLPFMWDEDHWAVRADVAFLTAAVLTLRKTPSAETRPAVVAHASALIQPVTVLFYTSSFFWKLNPHFLDTRGGCASIYMVTLLGSMLPEGFLLEAPSGQALLWLAAQAGPFLTIVGEAAIAVLLLFPPQYRFFRRVGVGLALLLHLAIAFTPEPFNVTEYSIVCVVRLFFFIPDAAHAALVLLEQASVASKLGLAAVALGTGAINPNPLGVIGGPLYTALTILYGLALVLDARTADAPPAAPPLPDRARLVAAKRLIGLESFAFCFLLLALGLADHGPSKPFANIRSSHGASNHLFAPLNLLPNALKAYSSAEYTLGGGVYRVDDSDAGLLNERFPGRIEQHAAKHVRLLKAANHTSTIFSPASATIIAPFLAVPNTPGKGAFTRYTLPARELRRALHDLYAANGAPFYLEYAHLPDYTGEAGPGSGHAPVARRVRVEHDGEGGAAVPPRCTVLTKGVLGLEARAPCPPDELALLPPTPWWSRKLMLAWPYPVLPGEEEGQRGFCHGE